MAVYRDADPRKNMNHAQIATAIGQVETSGVTIAAAFTYSIIGADGTSQHKQPELRHCAGALKSLPPPAPSHGR
jgi:hypothetical protein